MKRPFLEFAGYLQAEMARDADNAIVIDGYEGSGKSNLGSIIAKLVDADFNPADEAIFNMQDWNRIFDENEKEECYLIDEAGNLLFSRDYASFDSKFVVKLLMQARILRSTIIMCLPNLFFLDKYVRESRIKFRIRMDPLGLRNNLGRTMALLQSPILNWRTGDIRFHDVAMLTNIPSFRELWPDLWNGYSAKKEAAVRSFTGEHRQMMKEGRLRREANIKRLEAELAG